MTIHGRIDCYAPAQRGLYGSGAASRHLMKMTWDALNHFASLGLCELVAWYKGHLGTSPGSDGPEGANPWGTNGWFLFRFPPTANRTWPWYFHMQWTIGYSTGMEEFGITDHPGKLLGLANVNDHECIGVQVARGIGSTATIWNGTANADGNDTKGTAPYWKVPAGGTRVAVLGRSNGPSGTFVTGKQNFTPIYYADADFSSRCHFLCDGDALVILSSFNDSPAYVMRYFGACETQPNLVDGTFAMLNSGLPWSTNSDYGSLAGNDWFGGIDVAGQERIMKFESLFLASGNYIPIGSMNPNHLYSPARYDQYRIPIVSNEALIGFAGFLNHALIEESFCVATNTVNGDATRAFFGDGGSSTQCVSIAWDGASTPGINMTRAGIDF